MGRKRPQSRRKKDNEQVLMEIQESHKKSKEIYGSPRITEDLHAKGIRCGKNRVARIMRNNGIVASVTCHIKLTEIFTLN